MKERRERERIANRNDEANHACTLRRTCKTTAYVCIIVQLCRYEAACLGGRNECEIDQSFYLSRAMISVEN